MVEDEGSWRKSRPLLGVACWAVCLMLYLAMAGRLGWAEVVAGSLSSLLATLAVFVSGDTDYLGHMRPGWWLLLLRRLPGKVLGDTARVGGALLSGRRLDGVLRWVPFDAGGDDPISGSRRALVKAGASLAPNSYVVIIDPENRRMLTHQFVPTNGPPGDGDTQWPV